VGWCVGAAPGQGPGGLWGLHPWRLQNSPGHIPELPGPAMRPSPLRAGLAGGERASSQPKTSWDSTFCPFSVKPTRTHVPLGSSLPDRPITLLQHSQRGFHSLFLTQLRQSYVYTSPLLPAPLGSSPPSTFNTKVAIQRLTLDVSTQAGCITSTPVYKDTCWSLLFPSIPLPSHLGEAKVIQPCCTSLRLSPPLEFPPTLLLLVPYIAESQLSSKAMEDSEQGNPFADEEKKPVTRDEA